MVVNNISSDSGVRIQEGYWSKNQGAPQAPQGFKQTNKQNILYLGIFKGVIFFQLFFPFSYVNQDNKSRDSFPAKP